MKRSPNSVKIALSAAAIASGLAYSVPAFAAPYITVDLLARPAQFNATLYSPVANGTGYSDLGGYIPTAPGTNGSAGNTTGFTSIITPTSVGQAYELLIRITLASQGTTNTFASGFSSIINWNPSTNSSAASGITSLKFMISQSTAGIQTDLQKMIQGSGFTPDPGGDGSQPYIDDSRIVVDRLSDPTASTSARWDIGGGASGGTLSPRGNGFNNAANVTLVRNSSIANQQFGGIAGTNAAPTTPAQNAAVAYFTIGSTGATSTLGLDLSVGAATGFAASTNLAGMRYLASDADTTGINGLITAGMQAASVAGNDPIIKVNGLTLQGTAAAVTPANIVVSPASGSNLNTGGHVTVSNTAAGATVDPAVLSSISVTNALPNNATWAQVGLTTADINGGANQTNTVTVTPAANLLAGAVGNGTLSFSAAGKTTAASAGAGNYSYNLLFTNASNSAPTGAGTTFGTTQTADVASGAKVAGLSSTESGSLLNKVEFLDSTTIAGVTSVTAAWRHRSTQESYPGTTPPLPAQITSLITDVVNVSLGNNAPATYVLQLNYDPNSLGVGLSETLSFNAGHLYLAHMTDGGGANGDSNDSWANAGNPNLGVLRAYTASDLNTVGQWGIDSVNHVAWAVMPSSEQGQFAVVPEPASLGLLALGALGLIRRRK